MHPYCWIFAILVDLRDMDQFPIRFGYQSHMQKSLFNVYEQIYSGSRNNFSSEPVLIIRETYSTALSYSGTRIRPERLC